MRNQPVFQVLATKGNQAVLTAGKTLDDLAIGQIGVFDRETNLSISATSVAPEIYLALGIDTGGGVKGILKSAGQHIQARGVKDLNVNCYEAGQPKVIELHNMTSVNGKDYTMKFQFMNGDLLGINGYQLPNKSFSVQPKNCLGKCDPCPQDEDCRTLPVLFYDEIVQDTDNLLTVELIQPDGTVIAREDYETWIADSANDGLCPGLRISAIKENVYKWCAVNINYRYLRETDFTLSLMDDFNCSKTVVNITEEVVYEQGSGYDVMQDEYFAGGWNGNPGVYRVSSVFGLPLGDFNFQANIDTKYTQFTLLYDLNSISGWRHYDNNLETRIAVPCADTTTKNGLATLLDGWASVNVSVGLKPIAAEASACTC